MRSARINPGAILHWNTAVIGIEICIGHLSAAFACLPLHAATPKLFPTPTPLWRHRTQVLLPESTPRKWSGANGFFTAFIRLHKPRHGLPSMALQTFTYEA